MVEHWMDWKKEELPEACKTLRKEDIAVLIPLLSEKNDTIRYQAFLILQARSQIADDVYPYWDTFREKLKSGNSYQRSIGAMLIAENARWDTEHKTEDTLTDYLTLLQDEKPITVRQCIQSLPKICTAQSNLDGRIAEKLMELDLLTVKETMRKLILLDILQVLIHINKEQQNESIQGYILHALSGEILDKKSKKQIEQWMQ